MPRETLRALIKSLGWTPYSIAVKAGLHPASVRSWCGGTVQPWGEKAEALAAALGVDVKRVMAAVAASRRK